MTHDHWLATCKNQAPTSVLVFF